MATGGIVPPLDVAEDRHPGLGLRCEPAACQQLTFQCGEEALAHGVVVGVTDRSHGWTHAGFPAAAAERQRCILPWSLWWMTLLGLRWPIAISNAASTSSVRRCLSIAQPTIRRLNASSTTARYRKPAAVGTYVMSATQSWLGRSAVKFRSTRSGAGRAS